MTLPRTAAKEEDDHGILRENSNLTNLSPSINSIKDAKIVRTNASMMPARCVYADTWHACVEDAVAVIRWILGTDKRAHIEHGLWEQQMRSKKPTPQLGGVHTSARKHSGCAKACNIWSNGGCAPDSGSHTLVLWSPLTPNAPHDLISRHNDKESMLGGFGEADADNSYTSSQTVAQCNQVVYARPVFCTGSHPAAAPAAN